MKYIEKSYMTKNNYSSFLYFILFFGIILLFTHGLFNNFFEQDEWGAFGDTIHSFNLPWWNMLISRGVHFSPLGSILWLIIYKIYALQANYYVLIELILHTIATYSVFILSKRLTKNIKIGFLTAILFGINGRAYEGFMHLALFSTTVPALIFIVLFFVYLTGIKNKYLTPVNTFILIAIFLCSVFFREEGIIIIPLFSVYLFFFDKRKINKKNFKYFFIFILNIFVFFLLRVVSGFLNVTPIPTSSWFSYPAAIYNFFSLPVKFIVQNLIDSHFIFGIFMNWGNHIYPNLPVSFPTIYPVFMDLAFTIIFCIFLSVLGVWLYFSKNKSKFAYLGFAFVWIISNALILSVVGRRLYIVDERYLYFSSFPVMLILSILLASIFSFKKGQLTSKITKLLVIVLLFVLILSSYLQIQAAVKRKVFTGQARAKILSSVKALYPTIPKNTIFYFKCKGECYRNAQEFGLPNTYELPFLAGTGWTILVEYSVGHEKTWGKFLTNIFLLDRGAQGYEKIGNYSFGYFTDRKLLKQVLKKNNLSSNIVIGLEYNEENFTVKNISNIFRKQLNEN